MKVQDKTYYIVAGYSRSDYSEPSVPKFNTLAEAEAYAVDKSARLRKELIIYKAVKSVRPVLPAVESVELQERDACDDKEVVKDKYEEKVKAKYEDIY